MLRGTALFDEWKASQHALSSAADHYSRTSIALEAAADAQTSLERVAAAAESDLAYIESMKTSLLKAKTSLSRIRNRSVKMVPINLLPEEILTQIFGLATRITYPSAPLSKYEMLQKQIYGTILALTQVCADWRRLCINTASLWSDLYYVFPSSAWESNYTSNDSLWLRRVGSSPLSVRMWTLCDYSIHFGRLMGHLRPRWGRVSQLHVIAHHYEPLCITIKNWLKYGNQDSVKTLQLSLNGWAGSSLLNQYLPRLSKPYTQQTLASVEVLRLHSVHISWDSLAYHGLVELQLEHISWTQCPTLPQLSHILSSCPNLHTLRLLDASPKPGKFELPLIPLRSLQVLELIGVSLSPILSILGPGPLELGFHVDLGWDGPKNKELETFFMRSNLTRLFITSSNPFLSPTGEPQDLSEWIDYNLPLLRNLRTLIIDLGSRNGDKELESLVRIRTVSPADPSARGPDIHTLHLLNGSVSAGMIQDVVAVYQFKKLRFWSCYIDPFEEELIYSVKDVVEDIVSKRSIDEHMVDDWHLYIN